jgi:hypothetical protein
MTNNNSQNQSPNGIKAFLFWCASASSRVLTVSGTAQKNRIAFSGFMILLFAVMCAFSMGVFLHYHGMNFAGIFTGSIFFGIIIFFIQRFLAAIDSVGDGTSKISYKELIDTTWNLCITIVLTYIMAAPLQVYIFNKHIVQEIEFQNKEYIREEKSKLMDSLNRSPKYIKLVNDTSQLFKDREKLVAERLNYQQLAAMEITTKNGGCGGKCEEFKRMAEAVEDKIKEADNSIKELEVELKKFEHERDIIIKSMADSRSNIDFWDRYLTLSDMQIFKIPSTLILLLFAAISMIPYKIRFTLTSTNIE